MDCVTYKDRVYISSYKFRDLNDFLLTPVLFSCDLHQPYLTYDLYKLSDLY